MFGFCGSTCRMSTAKAHSGVASNHDNPKVPVAQITTLGSLSGQMTVQIFENGDPNDEIRMTFCSARGTGSVGHDRPGSVQLRNLRPGHCVLRRRFMDPTVLGCTSAGACNYNAAANTNDGLVSSQTPLATAKETASPMKTKMVFATTTPRGGVRRPRRLQRPRCRVLLRF